MSGMGARNRGLPPPVSLDLDEPRLAAYFRDRVTQHTEDSYMGVPLSKFPEDLRVYQHLLWLDRVDTVIELGTQFGGGALWFRDQMLLMRQHGRITESPLVITIDVDQQWARDETRDQAGIKLLEGPLDDPTVIAEVERLVKGRCLVVEDSAHTFETTTAALRNYARFVGPGGFMIVEDGCVDRESLRSPEWPRGVLPAIHEWLQSPEGSGFSVRRDLELYGVTCHPEGFLQRAADSR